MELDHDAGLLLLSQVDDDLLAYATEAAHDVVPTQGVDPLLHSCLPYRTRELTAHDVLTDRCKEVGNGTHPGDDEAGGECLPSG